MSESLDYIEPEPYNFPYEDYNIIGDTSEIDKIINFYGSININVIDVMTTLSKSSSNYVTIGTSKVGSVIDALEFAVKNLKETCSAPIEKILFNVWIKRRTSTLSVKDLNDMVDYIDHEFKGIRVVWGVANDESLDDKVKITLIVASK